MSHDVYSALSDPTRRRILTALRGGSRPVGDLVTELGASQPTVSKHLKVLREAGMVATRAQGQRRFYRLAAEPFTEVLDWVGELVSAADAGEPHDRAASEPAVVDPQGPLGADDVPAPARTPERSLPWFMTEATDSGAEDSQDMGTPDAPEGASSSDVSHNDPRPKKTPDETESPSNAEVSGESKQDFREIVQAESSITEETIISADPEGPTDGREGQAAGDSLDAGSHHEPAAQPHAAHDAEHQDTEPRAASSETDLPEIAEFIRPRGAAHRRQGGLLSTLTGLRRRNRGARRG